MVNAFAISSSFVSSSGLFRRNAFTPARTSSGAPRRVCNRIRVIACLPSQKPRSATQGEELTTNINSDGKPKMSKTEQIAIMLGKNTDDMRVKSEKIKEEGRAEKRMSYGLALSSFVVGGVFFFVQYLDPNSSINLMQFMTQSSAPVDIIGTNGKPTLIEFSAAWCENCKYMAQRVFDLEKQYAGRINFVVVDGEDPERTDIVDKYGVDAIPQFSMISKDGKVEANLVGLVPKDVLMSDLDALLGDEALPFKGISLEQLKGPDS